MIDGGLSPQDACKVIMVIGANGRLAASQSMALSLFLVLYLRFSRFEIVCKKNPFSLAFPGKLVPEDAVLEMKFNYSLPEARDEYVDDVIWIELSQQDSNEVVRQ